MLANACSILLPTTVTSKTQLVKVKLEFYMSDTILFLRRCPGSLLLGVGLSWSQKTCFWSKKLSVKTFLFPLEHFPYALPQPFFFNFPLSMSFLSSSYLHCHHKSYNFSKKRSDGNQYWMRVGRNKLKY